MGELLLRIATLTNHTLPFVAVDFHSGQLNQIYNLRPTSLDYFDRCLSVTIAAQACTAEVHRKAQLSFAVQQPTPAAPTMAGPQRLSMLR